MVITNKLAHKWAWPGARDPISKLAGVGAYCGGHLAVQLVIIIIIVTHTPLIVAITSNNRTGLQ